MTLVYYGIYQLFLLGMNITHKRIFIIVTEAKFFFSHRYALIKKLSQDHIKFHVITYFEDKVPPDESNIKYTFLNSDRKAFSLVNFFQNSYKLHCLIKEFSPDIVYAISHRSIFLASIANLFLKKKLLFAISGIGSIFSDGLPDKKFSQANLLKILVIKVYQLVIKEKNSFFIFQNTEDLNVFRDYKITDSKKNFIIPGNGLEKSFFHIADENQQVTKFIMIARILRDKGVIEFLQAAQKVLSIYPDITFSLYGSFDFTNPKVIKFEELKKYLGPSIKYEGHAQNIRSEIINSSAVVLPSYREGFSRVLMEAQACSKPVITSDVPGCRDVIIENITGYLVKPQNVTDLVGKIIMLVENNDEYNKMSRNAFKHAENSFSLDRAVQKHHEIFNKLTSI